MPPTKRQIIAEAALACGLTKEQLRRLRGLGYLINGQSRPKAIRSIRALRLKLGDAAEVFGWSRGSNMLYRHADSGDLPLACERPKLVTIQAMQDLVAECDGRLRGPKK